MYHVLTVFQGSLQHNNTLFLKTTDLNKSGFSVDVIRSEEYKAQMLWIYFSTSEEISMQHTSTGKKMCCSGFYASQQEDWLSSHLATIK